jgi:hypothetical protein
MMSALMSVFLHLRLSPSFTAGYHRHRSRSILELEIIVLADEPTLFVVGSY